MAGGNDQNKKANRQNNRLSPGIAQGTSRVSKVVGAIGSESVRVEQRANSPATKQNSRPANAAPKSKRAQGSKQGANRPAYVPPPSPDGTADSRVIAKARDMWSNLEPHHQQRLLGTLLLALSLFLFATLTLFRTVPLFSAINGAFLALFGWSAYLLAIGLVAFSIAHLIEGFQNTRLIRWSLVIGLIFLWLILLTESHLLLGGTTGGVLGSLLARPLQGWPASAGQILLLGLFTIVTIITFQISWGHLVSLARAVGLTSSRQKTTSTNNTPTFAQYRGQRPRFSRYGSALAPRQQGQSPPNMDADVDEEDEDLIDFESDFDHEDDALNDINLHKDLISRVPREPRSPQPIDVEEHSNAVQGVQQQPLPFNQVQAAKAPGKQPSKPAKPVEKKLPTLEPLAPNPQKKGLSKIFTPHTPDSAWILPNTSLLNNPEEVKLHMLGDDIATLAKTIQDTLRSFRVEAEVRQEDISVGPTVIRFGIRPTGRPEMKQDEKGKYVPVRDANGNMVYESRTRVSRIMALQNDLALVLEAKTIRMEAPVPGRPYVGVEIPNKNSRLVTLREVLESKEYQTVKAKSKLAVALGKDVAGAVRVADLARMPHLLIAGATGAGKSVCLNTIIASILTQAAPDDVRMLLVDPKMVELNMYNGIPHLLSPVVTEVEKVVPLLKNAIAEMERRYRLFSQVGVRNLDGYRKLRADKIAHGDTSLKSLPAIVIIIDELADLMMAAPEEVESMICRLAQLARATGIHLVIATQRPSVDVITGLIKANIPTRISFMVSSAVDSRTIIDMAGAERLLGRGDMLYLPSDAGRPERIQGAFLADDEVEALISYWRQQALERTNATNRSGSNQPESGVIQPAVELGWEIKEQPSDDFELEDDLLEHAEDVVREYGRASISLLQRRLRIGYSRAARLIDLLEARGINGSGSNQPDSAVQPAVESGWEIKEQPSDDFELEDDLLEHAEDIVREYGRASISLLQRRLRIGYSRAARLIDLLEARGIIGPSEAGGRSREVLENGNADKGSAQRGGSGGEGRTMADEVADIIAEEKAREAGQRDLGKKTS